MTLFKNIISPPIVTTGHVVYVFIINISNFDYGGGAYYRATGLNSIKLFIYKIIKKWLFEYSIYIFFY